MNRRQSLKLLSAAVAGAAPARPVQLHIDLEVDPAKEKDLVAAFRNVFRPAIRRQPGFVEVRLLKLRGAVAGGAPEGLGYRLLISFESEELRQKWVASADHQQAWPEIEKTLGGRKLVALLYDVV
jgi:heme-degrading monooxygenase HmoA